MDVIQNCIIIFCVATALADQWVDPHNMNTNAKAKYEKPILKKSQSTSCIGEEPLVDNSFLLCSTNMKRIIGIVLNSAYLDKTNPEVYKGHIEFNIKSLDYDFLLNFGRDKDLGLEQFRKLDTIFSESFKKSYIDAYHHELREFGVKFYKAIFHIETLWMLGIPFLLYIVYQLFINKFSFSYVTTYLIILVLIVDYGHRYKHLLQEVEEHNLNVAYSKQCDSEFMTLTDWTKYLFGSLECKKKFITPLNVMLDQIENIIVIPMQAFGTGMGKFGKNMFNDLPFIVNVILWPAMLIFTLALTLIILTFCTGNSIELNLFRLIKMRFGGNNVSPSIQSNDSNSQPIEPPPHRPLVQNIHITVASTKSEKENISIPVIEMIEPTEIEKQLQESNKTEDPTISVKKETTDKGTNTAYVRANRTEEDKDCISDEDILNSNLDDGKSQLKS